MKRPSGEMVSLDFYFDDRKSPDALKDIVSYCMENGAQFSGEVIESEFEGARDTFFFDVYASYTVREKHLSENDLMAELTDPNKRVTTVGLWNAIGVTKGKPEIVTFNGTFGEPPGKVNNPIAIVGEGWQLSTPGYEKEAKNDARKCYRKFIEICRVLRPDYAAILNEDSLLCPNDLKRGGGERLFTNFFLSESCFGSELLDYVESMFSDAYTERSDVGLYVGTWKYGPEIVSVDYQSAFQRSKKIAKMIGSRCH